MIRQLWAQTPQGAIFNKLILFCVTLPTLCITGKLKWHIAVKGAASLHNLTGEVCAPVGKLFRTCKSLVKYQVR